METTGFLGLSILFAVSFGFGIVGAHLERETIIDFLLSFSRKDGVWLVL